MTDKPFHRTQKPEVESVNMPEYKYAKELPEPITCMVDHMGYLIVASANKIFKAKLPDGEILYQMKFAMLEDEPSNNPKVERNAT